MKKLTVIISLSIFILNYSNCFSQKDQSDSDSELEQAVFYQIFPAILDSIHSDFRLIPPPPPSPDYLRKRGYDVDNKESPYITAYENWKKSQDFEIRNREWEKKRDSIERDTTSIYLTIPDSIGRTEEDDIMKLVEHFTEYNISADSFIVSNPFQIDISKLKTHQSKVRFIYQSKLPGDGKFWRNDYGKYIAASMSFTKIIFDKSKSFGVLNAGYVKGTLNGYGVRIFIKKNENGEWQIDEVKGTWIS